MSLFNPTNSATIVSGTSTPTTVGASTNSVTILPANANRHGATIYNGSTANLYIEFGAVATSAAYVAPINAGGYYEVPFGYTGQISGIWSAANGSAFIRELTT
jgi:hypothetical protein